MTDLRVLVCGGRDYHDREQMWTVLNRLRLHLLAAGRGLTVISGDAAGADALAETWAEEHGVDCIGYVADQGQQMLDAGVDAVIAFPGGRGTADMISRAARAGVPIWKQPR